MQVEMRVFFILLRRERRASTVFGGIFICRDRFYVRMVSGMEGARSLADRSGGM
jgi:hypothetical protein